MSAWSDVQSVTGAGIKNHVLKHLKCLAHQGDKEQQDQIVAQAAAAAG